MIQLPWNGCNILTLLIFFFIDIRIIFCGGLNSQCNVNASNFSYETSEWISELQSSILLGLTELVPRNRIQNLYSFPYSESEANSITKCQHGYCHMYVIQNIYIHMWYIMYTGCSIFFLQKEIEEYLSVWKTLWQCRI